MRFGRVPELHHQRMTAQQTLHGCTLNSFTASVNQAHNREARVACRRQIVIYDRHDVARRERMQIDRVFDRDGDRVVIHGGAVMPEAAALLRPWPYPWA